MDRFFSSKNIDFYRKLANNAIKVGERRRVLELLVKEMSAFKHECRAPAERKGACLRRLLASSTIESDNCATSNHV